MLVDRLTTVVVIHREGCVKILAISLGKVGHTRFGTSRNGPAYFSTKWVLNSLLWQMVNPGLVPSLIATAIEEE